MLLSFYFLLHLINMRTARQPDLEKHTEMQKCPKYVLLSAFTQKYFGVITVSNGTDK